MGKKADKLQERLDAANAAYQKSVDNLLAFRDGLDKAYVLMSATARKKWLAQADAELAKAYSEEGI